MKANRRHSPALLHGIVTACERWNPKKVSPQRRNVIIIPATSVVKRRIIELLGLELLGVFSGNAGASTPVFILTLFPQVSGRAACFGIAEDN